MTFETKIKEGKERRFVFPSLLKTWYGVNHDWMKEKRLTAHADVLTILRRVYFGSEALFRNRCTFLSSLLSSSLLILWLFNSLKMLRNREKAEPHEQKERASCFIFFHLVSCFPWKKRNRFSVVNGKKKRRRRWSCDFRRTSGKEALVTRGDTFFLHAIPFTFCVSSFADFFEAIKAHSREQITMTMMTKTEQLDSRESTKEKMAIVVVVGNCSDTESIILNEMLQWSLHSFACFESSFHFRLLNWTELNFTDG